MVCHPTPQGRPGPVDVLCLSLTQGGSSGYLGAPSATRFPLVVNQPPPPLAPRCLRCRVLQPNEYSHKSTVSILFNSVRR